MKHCLLVSLFFALTCCAQLGNKPANWKSVYREITFDYSDPWSLLPTLDTKEKTLSGVIDNRDGKSYIIHITDDVSKGQLSDEVYFKGIEQTMLRAKIPKILELSLSFFFNIN